jgi:hypothetical protein
VITIINPEEILVEFSLKASPQKVEFISLTTAIEPLVNQETARRTSIIRQLSNNSGIWESNEFGTLQFSNYEFAWTGAEKLGTIIPSGSPISGRLLFDLYLVDPASASYNNALWLVFNGSTLALPIAMSVRQDQLYIQVIDQESIIDLTGSTLIEPAMTFTKRK